MCLFLASVLYSCARMGRPEGGPRDVLAPIYIRSNPGMRALNVSGNKIDIEFDELVLLKEQNEKVIVSPAQKQQPVIRSNGRHVTVELKDTMLENTTYTISFADAIQDFTENNPLEDFVFSFSTGDSIDSLQISGVLLDARTLEPQQKMLVGVHSNLHDSAFTTLPFDRVARSNDRGQFTIYNLKPGQYKLYAINDVDRNNMYSAGEDIAVYPGIITPKAESLETPDTIYTPTHELDTVIMSLQTSYYPNDILLSMFNENKKTQYLVEEERRDSSKLYLQFATKADTLPGMKLIDFPDRNDWYKLDRSATNDTLTYWITDMSLATLDTIRVELKYLKTDTLNQLSPTTDTILFKYNRPKLKKQKKKKKDEDIDSLEINKPKPTNFELSVRGSQDVNLPLRFVAGTPLDTLIQGGVRLLHKVDSVWENLTPPLIERDNNLSQHGYHASYDWIPGDSYKIIVDSASVIDIYGRVNDSISQEFKVKALDEYCSVVFKVTIPDSAFIELMQSDDKASYIAPVVRGEAVFDYVNPGNYYARLIVDKNNNMKWDTGSLADGLQPEDVYYYNKKLNLRRNWDMEENWDLNALPVDMQKPIEIKKNKPARKKWEVDDKRKNGAEDEDEYNEEDEVFDVNRNPFAPSSSRKNATTHY